MANNNNGYAVLNAVPVISRETSLRENSLYLESIVGSLERIFNRNFEVNDPVTRYTLFLDKLYMFIDISISMSEAYVKYSDPKNEISTDHIIRIKRLALSIQEEMKKLSNWVQNPIYSPDHPLGKMMMESAKNDFNKNIKNE